MALVSQAQTNQADELSMKDIVISTTASGNGLLFTYSNCAFGTDEKKHADFSNDADPEQAQGTTSEFILLYL